MPGPRESIITQATRLSSRGDTIAQAVIDAVENGSVRPAALRTRIEALGLSVDAMRERSGRIFVLIHRAPQQGEGSMRVCLGLGGGMTLDQAFVHAVHSYVRVRDAGG